MEMPAKTSPSSVNVPPVPREPSERARQLIFRYQGSQLVLLLVGVGFLAIGGVLATVFGWRLPEDVAISLGGHASTARVVDTEVEDNVTINGRHPMLIRFRYDVDGRQHEEWSRALDRAIITGAQPGTDVPIEVASLNSGWARVRGTTASMMGLWGLSFLLGPTVGALLIFFAVRSNRREIRAYIHGQPITARVIFAGPETRVRMNGRNPLVVRWEFTVEGRTFKGSLSSLNLPLIKPLMKQQELTVLYVPDDPRINTAYVN
jgi:hypothetical protein